MAETKAEAMIQGVDPARIDRAAKLIATYDGDTAAAKVTAFLTENPEFKTGTPVLPKGGAGFKSQGSDGAASLKADVSKAFGLKKGIS